MSGTESSGGLYWTPDIYAYNSLKLMERGNAILMMPKSDAAPATDWMGRQDAAIRLGSVSRNMNGRLLLAEDFSSSYSAQDGCFAANTLCILHPDAATCKARGFTVTIWMRVLSVSYTIYTYMYIVHVLIPFFETFLYQQWFFNFHSKYEYYCM